MDHPALRPSDLGAQIARIGPGLACLIALVVVACGFGARMALDPLLGQKATFLFFIPAVVVAAAMAGLWPGLLATVLGIGAGLAVDSLTGGVDAGTLVGAAAFLFVGSIVTVGGEWFQRALAGAEEINRAVAQREAHLRSILETIPDAMVVIDEAGLIRDFSQAAERQFGWKADEVTG